jgi:hypothetical protein
MKLWSRSTSLKVFVYSRSGNEISALREIDFQDLLKFPAEEMDSEDPLSCFTPQVQPANRKVWCTSTSGTWSALPIIWRASSTLGMDQVSTSFVRSVLELGWLARV